MTVRRLNMLCALCLLFMLPKLCGAQNGGGLPVAIPDGTKVSAIKYGDDETPVTLKPAEQVAFLFVNGLWGLQEECLDKDSGLARLCSLVELLRGPKTKDGRTISLSVNPVKDTNYRYEVMTIGDYCVIRALPRVRDIGGFAMVGSPRGFGGTMYFDPKGGDLANAKKVTEMGYQGNGFRR